MCIGGLCTIFAINFIVVHRYNLETYEYQKSIILCRRRVCGTTVETRQQKIRITTTTTLTCAENVR